MSIGAFVLTLFVVQRPATGTVQVDVLPHRRRAADAADDPRVRQNINGARIWVDLGPLGFQPGEFAKLALAIFLAGYLSERRELIATSTWKIGPVRLPEIRTTSPP